MINESLARAHENRGWPVRSTNPSLVGQVAGRYRIVSRLGRGGTADVYLAEHPPTRRRVAIKVLSTLLAGDGEAMVRFLEEAHAANASRHPNVVEVLGAAALSDGRPFIVMELLEGETLSAALRRTGSLDPATAVRYTVETACALSAIHGQGIVHRDLKPDNLFLVADPARPDRSTVKVLDFGVARLAGTIGQPRAGAIVGTPLYMSPEQCVNPEQVDVRSDIYALGLILYEMLSGAPPFVADALGAIIHMHRNVPPWPLCQRVPSVPRALAAVVHRALAKCPEFRFRSAEEMARATWAALG
jgi:serine/threonine protein kinase